MGASIANYRIGRYICNLRIPVTASTIGISTLFVLVATCTYLYKLTVKASVLKGAKTN